MGKRDRWFIFFLLAAFIHACTLPGASAPTPFTFPTPNLTHTAIFAATPASEVPTLAPLETGSAIPPPPAPTATIPESLETPLPQSPTPLPTATSSSLNQRPNGAPVIATYLSTNVTIDGNISEWTTLSYTANETVPLAGNNWSGPDDLSATFHIAWDANYLYLAVNRKDDAFVQISWGRYMYRGDDVEIQLDTDLAGDFYTAGLSPDDYQIGLSPGNFGSIDPEIYRWHPRSLESWIRTGEIAARRTNGGYTLEAKIPWSAFNIAPTADSRYGFALSFSDNDNAGTSSWQSMVSNVNTRKTTNPTTWGTLILEGP